MRSILLLSALLLLTGSLFAQSSALSFDGEEEYLEFQHNDAYNIGTGFTIEAWIFAEEWRQFQWQGSILNKDNQGPDRGYAFRCGDNGILSFVMAVDNVWQEAFTAQVMNANQWHHVAAVVDNGTITLYVDGQPSATHSFTGNISHASDLPNHIGGSPGFGGRNFNGVIDEVRIWSSARTQAELLDNSIVDLTGNEENLVAYFPMNEGQGLIAKDLSPTSNDCALVLMDDSNWVNGYALPDYDISVQEVYGVDVVNMIDRPVKLRVDIQNTGILSIADIDLTVSIDGEAYNTENVSASIAPGEVYAYEFVLPIDLIGLTDPEISVEASHPQDGNALNNSSQLEVKTGTSTEVIVSDQELHKNGEQLNSILMTLPNDLHRYEQMLLNIDLTCPTGGCGAWDVLADLRAITSTGTYELARYITPYGIACGGWVVDITDFKSVLGGQVEFLTNILVYTEEGWLVDMSIDLIDNNPEDTYSTLSPLWERSYLVYGDPGISYDLAELPIDVQSNTANSHVRMTITGHGQGNTNNAAEFFNVTHTLNVDGSVFDNHNLWKDDCASNPCANQAGSWLFSRAGWCPGQHVEPYIINTSSVATAGSTVNLDYELQEYTNLLNTGYNNSDHTEPYYRLYSYFIEEAPTAYEDFRNLVAVSATPFVNNDLIENINFTFENNGLEALEGYTINVFYNSQLVTTANVDETVAVGETVERLIDVNTPVVGTAPNSVFVEISSNLDDNPGDNVVKSDFMTSTSAQALEYNFQLFPNPTPDGTVQFLYDEYWNDSTLKLYNAAGVLVQETQLGGVNSNSIRLSHQGAYWYILIHPEQESTTSGKVLYLD